MSQVVRVALEDSKGAINLLEQHYAGQLVSNGELSQGKDGVSGFPGLLGEAIRRADGKHERQRVAVPMVRQKLRELFRGELPATGVQDDERMPGLDSARQLDESGFVFHAQTFDWVVMRNPFQVFSGEGFDGRFFRPADPGYFELHRWDLTTMQAREQPTLPANIVEWHW